MIIPQYMHKKIDKNIRENCTNSDNNKGFLGYFAIAIAVLLLYVFSVKYSFLYHEAKVPRGDPFSYTVGFFSLIDGLHANFCRTFFSIFYGRGWYWLINCLISILYPFIFKEPYSIALVNFVVFGFATASIFRLARYLSFNMSVAFLMSMLLWLFPSNYGFQHPISLMQMQLDTAFLFAVIMAVANLLIYAFSVEKTKNAFWAAVSIGFAVWGRGNSLPYISICVFFPMIIIVKKLLSIEEQKKKALFNFAGFSLTIIILAGGFYVLNWKALSGYYGVHASVVKHQASINFAGILGYLKDLPGGFYRYREPYWPFTIGSHLLVLLSLCGVTFVRNKNLTSDKKDFLKIISVTGGIIFYGILFFNLVFFNDPNFAASHNFALMLAGLVFCGFSLSASFVGSFKFKSRFRVNEIVILVLICFCFMFYGRYFIKKHTPLDFDLSAANPREVEAFACGIDKFLAGRSLAVLWYEMYNGPIINYYRIKNNLPMISFYTNEFYTDLWLPPYSPNNREKILNGIKKTLSEADFIIIPEFSDSYYKYEPYPFYHCSDDLASYLNSPESPKFVVRWLLHEPGNIRLLLLQKEKDALNEVLVDFEPLKLPYGPSNLSIKSKYSLVPSDKLAIPAKNPIIEVSNQTGTHHYERAFDRSITPDSFWEVGGQYPFWMVFEYRDKMKINKYFLQTGECSERMPIDWQLQGSMDGKDWVTLDKRENEKKWEINEKRNYILSDPQEYEFYRLYFTNGGQPDILRIYEIGLSCTK